MRRARREAHHDPSVTNRDALRAFVDACQIFVGQVDTNAEDSATLLRDLLMRVLRRTHPPRPHAPTTNFRVARVLHYLESDFADSTLDLVSAARQVDVTPSYLDRLLKAHTGLTFLQQLRRIRIRNADRILLTTAASIKETSYHCGYATVSSFGRDFKRTHGCAPRVWREIRTLCLE
jgi:two-component system response regulator YesN